MHYYSFNISAFNNSTRHLTRLERSIYRDLIDMYYDTEQPISNDINLVSRKIIANSPEEIEVIEQILKEFFTATSEGYTKSRIEKEIDIYHSKADTARANGKLGGRPKKSTETQDKPSGLIIGTETKPTANPEESGLKANQELLTNNQEPLTILKTSDNPSDHSPVPYVKIVDLYHSVLPSLPEVQTLTNKRKGQISQRWKSKQLPDLETWKEYFEHVGESKFLMGLSQSNGSRKVFKANLEWLTNESNFVKVWENNYHE